MPSILPTKLFHAFAGAVPGASALLLHGGTVRFAAGFGLADLAQGTPATTATSYRLASVSKQFTAMAVLQLAAEGRLALADSLARFVAGAPPYWRQITIEQLLAHTSGLPDYEEHLPPGDAQLGDEDVLDLVRPLAEGYHAPGAAFRYSNTGYCLLALIAAQAAGRPFAELLRERIFQPIGMAQAQAGPPAERRAYGYSQRGAGWARTDQSRTSATLGDGGIYSSVEDLARWDAALAAGRLLPPALQARMFTPHAATPAGEAYGLGWFLRGTQLAYHTGETIGFRTAIVRRLDTRLTAIVLTNRSEANPLALAEALMANATHQ